MSNPGTTPRYSFLCCRRGVGLRVHGPSCLCLWVPPSLFLLRLLGLHSYVQWGVVVSLVNVWPAAFVGRSRVSVPQVPHVPRDTVNLHYLRRDHPRDNPGLRRCGAAFTMVSNPYRISLAVLIASCIARHGVA